MSTWLIRYQVPSHAFPIGARQQLGSVVATFVLVPVPYVIIATDAERIPDPVEERALEAARVRMSRMAGLTPSPAIPKLALAGPSEHEAMAFRTRLAHGQGWHPRMAASGLMTLGVALTTPDTVPASIAGDLGPVMSISTPAGPRRILHERDADGRHLISVVITVLSAETEAERR